MEPGGRGHGPQLLEPSSSGWNNQPKLYTKPYNSIASCSLPPSPSQLSHSLTQIRYESLHMTCVVQVLFWWPVQCSNRKSATPVVLRWERLCLNWSRNRSQRAVLLWYVSACAGSELLTTLTENFGEGEELINIKVYNLKRGIEGYENFFHQPDLFGHIFFTIW